MPKQYSYCSYCGFDYYPEQLNTWPRVCVHCKKTTWRSPIPVVVILARVVGGVVGIRRGIQPGKGLLALPGGYVDDGETVEIAAAREWFEEIGGRPRPEHFKLYSDAISSDRSKLLIFVEMAEGLAGMNTHRLAFVPNEEVTELVVLRGDEELAFSTHTVAMRDFLARK